MKKYLSVLMLAAAMLLPWAVNAQSLENYGFTTGVDVTKWVDMTSATQILTPTGNDGLASSVQNIGFEFPFGASTYTQYSVNTDGNLRLGATVTGTSYYSTPFSSTNANYNNPKINGFGCDGYGNSGTHYVKALMQETSEGDTMLVVEYCMGTYSTSTRDYLYKWQIHLYSDGNIDIVYPPASGIPAVPPAVAHQCGICASSSDGWVVQASTQSATHFTAGSTLTNAANTWFDAGRYYSFIHPSNISCPAPTALTASNVTTNSATLSWTRGGTESSWELTVGEDVFYPTDTFYTVSSLDGNTLYSPTVRAICGVGDTSFAAFGSFRTACVAISSLPYENDFESEPAYSAVSYAEALPSCWARINDATSTYNYYPYLTTTSTYVIHGAQSMYWYHATSTTYANNQYAVLPPVDLSVYNISDLTLSFFGRTTATAAPYPQFIVGVMTAPDSASTFVPLDTITLTTTATLYSVSLSGYTGTGAYIAIRSPRTSTSTAKYAMLDDIYLTDDWCNAPEAVTASASATEVTISWEPNGGSSFTVCLGGDTISNVTDTFYTFSSLTPDTIYNYGVSTDCSSSNSLFINGTIHTECLPLTAEDLPYYEDFESYGTGSASSISSCWAKGVVPITGTGTTTNYPYPYSTAAINGIRGLYFYAATTSTTSYYNWLVLPPIDDSQLSMSDLMVTFNLKRTATATHQARLIVGVTTDYHSTAGFVPVDTIDFSSTATGSVHEVEVDFSSYTGSGTYVLFYAPAPTTTSTYNAFYIDDITLRNIPSCFWPSVVRTNSVAADEAVISWTPDSRTLNPDSWSVEYGVHGFTPGEGTTETVYDTTVTLSSLTPNTLYDVYISANCGGDESDPALFSFRTSCVPIESLPYTQNFEDETTNSSNTPWAVPCMGHLNNATTYFGYPYLSSSTTYNHTVGGTKGLYWYAGTTTDTYGDYYCLVMPGVDPETYPVNTLQVRFWAKSSSTSYDVNFQVGVMTDPTDITTFQLVENVHVGGNTTWEEYTVAFGTYTGTGQYIAIKGVRPSSVWYAYMDDITIESMPNCPAITDLEAIPTVGAALLRWNHQAGYEDPDSYDVTYFATAAGASASTTVSVSTNSAILTGLTANTTYKAYVQADCGSEGYGLMDSIVFSTADYSCVEFDTTLTDSVSIGSGTTTEYYVPVGNFYNYSYTQQLITADELNGALLITGIDFQYAYSAAMTDKTDVTIYMANTSVSSLTSAFVPYSTNFVQVYSGSLNCTTGWNHFEFDNSFAYDGSSNLLIVVHDNSGDYNGSSYTFYAHSATGKARYVQNDSSPYNINTVSGGTSYANRANMRLHTTGCLTQGTCANPAVIVTDTDTATVTISWAPGSTETSWDVSYRMASDTVWTNEAYSYSTNSYTFTNLLPATEYVFRVSFLCGDGHEYFGEATATTPCAPVALPYTENFDGITTSTTAANYDVLPNCWDYTLIGSSTYTTGTYLPGVYYSSTYANSGSYSLRIAGKGYFMLPEMSASIDSLMISLNAYITSANYTNLVVGVMENGMFIPIDTAHLVVNEHTYVEMLLSNYHGNSRTLAFFNPNTTSSNDYSYVYIDDVRVEYVPECVRPITIDMIARGDTWATIVWDSLSDGYEVYVSTASVNPDTVAGAVYTPVIVDTVTLTGLAPNTEYYFYVRTDCGISGYSDWSNEMVFRTSCAAMPLPYSEDFESYASSSTATINPCWTKGTNSTTAYPYPSSTAITGSRSLYFYGYHPSSATTTSIYSYAALPMFQDSTNRLMLSFNVRRYSTVSNYYTTRLVIGVMDNPDDISTFFPMDTIDLHDAPASSIHGYEYCFNNYTGTGRYLAIYDEVPPLYGTSTYTYSYAYVDDIVVDTIPSCMRPQNVTVSGIGQDVATVHWNAGANATSFDIEYGLSGFTLGTGTIVTSSVDSVDLFGLNPSTQYDVYIRANCSATDQSNWSFVQSFATVCGPTALPMFFDPDNYSTGTSTPLPTCWTRTNNSTGSYNYYPYIYSSSSNAHSGTNVLYYYFTTTSGYSSDALMAFPEIDTVNFPMNTVEVSFWAKASATGKHYLVGVMTDPTNMSTFQVVDTVALTTTSTEYTVSFDNFTGHGAYVALRGVMEGSSTYYIYTDDIYIGVMSHCPRAYDLTAYDGTATGATLEWTDTIGSTQWVVEYGRMGDTVTTTVTASSNPYTLTGLTANTVYYYRVAPICSDGVQADWSHETHYFSTSQVPANVPYSYDFESGTEWGNWQTLSNNTVNWSRGNAVGHPGYSMYLSTDNGTTRSYNMSMVTNAAAYRDFDFGTTPHGYELSFDALIGGSTDGNYDGITVMVVDPAIVPEVSSTGLTSPWGHISTVDVRMDTVWAGESIYLDGMQGVKRIVIFHFNQATASTHPYIDSPDAIDNIAIGLQPCERPYNISTVSATTSGVTLTWEGDATANYEFVYRVQGAAATTNVFATTSSNTITLAGLPSATNFYCWVRKICSVTAGDTLASAWSSTGTFATLCGVVSAADTIFEDFESYTGVAYNTEGVLPNCWEGYNATNTLTAHVTNGSTYSYCISGTQAVTMTSGTTTNYTGGVDNYMRLVDIAEQTNTLTIAYWMCTESSTNGYLEVGYLTSNNYETGFVPVHRIDASSATVHSGNGLQTGHGVFDTVSFEGVPAGNYPICFHWNYTSSYYSVCIDDIAVWSSMHCYTPSNLIADTSSYNSLTFAWQTADSAEVVLMQGIWDESAYNPADAQISTTGTITFTGLNFNTQYTVAVRNLCEEGATSAWVLLTVTTADLPCFAPAQPTVADVDYTSATFTWTSNGLEAAWQVRVFNTTFEVIDTVTTMSYTIDGLTPGETYQAEVSALCGNDFELMSEASPATSFTTDVCTVPTGVNSSNVTYNSATISWTGTGVNRYEVEYGTMGYVVGGGTIVPVDNATTITLTGLEEQTAYDVYVRAYCTESIVSGWSAKHQFTTPASEIGIDNVDASHVMLYPNPASSTVTLTGIEGEATVTIVDMNGRTVASYDVRNSELRIDVSGYAKGAYFVRVTGEQTTAIRKLVVK